MSHIFAKADAGLLPLADQSVDLVFGSPPYTDARLYLEAGQDLGISRGTDEWVEWMLKVTAEALRVSRGAVVWIASGPTRDRNYQPACEGLMWEWFRKTGSMYRPCYWHRSGIPGSGGDQWFRADVEYAMCFKRPGSLPWTDNTAMGHPPKWEPGGKLSYRNQEGVRRHLIRGTSGYSAGDATYHKCLDRAVTEIANPGNVIAIATGGGKLGWDGAHENEAPFPEGLAEWFVRSLCPPGGTVLDPFSGSGTTVSVANAYGRSGIGLDLRMSQCSLGMRRLERPHQPVPRPGKVEHHPLFRDLS